MDQKDKITTAISELSPERLEKLRTLALNQLSDYQKTSYLFESFRDLKMREIMAKYCK